MSVRLCTPMIIRGLRMTTMKATCDCYLEIIWRYDVPENTLDSPLGRWYITRNRSNL
jgi:hypothetical protein